MTTWMINGQQKSRIILDTVLREKCLCVGIEKCRKASEVDGLSEVIGSDRKGRNKVGKNENNHE